MATFAFDESFTPWFRINDRISRIKDKSLFYDQPALPIVPPHFNNIIITECLHVSEDFSVFGGYFQDGAGKRYEEYDVVFKFGDDEKLCIEAERYDVMSSLQGKAIPRLIGLAFGNRNGEGYFGCLMTEKFGSCLDCEPICLAQSEKAIILNHLQDIHDIGLTYEDSTQINVLQRGAEFRLVGFDNMKERHQCTASGKAVDFTKQPDTLSVEDWNVICAHVRGLALDMDFWDEGTVTFSGYFWQKEGLPSIRIMELLFPYDLYTKYSNTDAIPDLLLRYFKHIQTLLENGRHDVEYLEAHINETTAQVERAWRRSIDQSLKPSARSTRPAPARATRSRRGVQVARS